jgi:hypothetical protein
LYSTHALPGTVFIIVTRAIRGQRTVQVSPVLLQLSYLKLQSVYFLLLQMPG